MLCVVCIVLVVRVVCCLCIVCACWVCMCLTPVFGASTCYFGRTSLNLGDDNFR